MGAVARVALRARGEVVVLVVVRLLRIVVGMAVGVRVGMRRLGLRVGGLALVAAIFAGRCLRHLGR